MVRQSSAQVKTSPVKSSGEDRWYGNRQVKTSPVKSGGKVLARLSLCSRSQLPSPPIALMGDVAQQATQPAVPARCRRPAALPTSKVSAA